MTPATKYGPACAVKMDPVVFEKRERALELGRAKLAVGRERLTHSSDVNRRMHQSLDVVSVERLRAHREVIARRHTMFKAKESALNEREKQAEAKKINGMLVRVETLRRRMEVGGADRASVEKLSHVGRRLKLRKVRLWAH